MNFRTSQAIHEECGCQFYVDQIFAWDRIAGKFTETHRANLRQASIKCQMELKSSGNFHVAPFFLRITLERQKCFKIMLRKLQINAGVYVVNVILNLRVSDNGKTDHVSTIANNFSH